MARLVLTIAGASIALLVACNSLSGADGLTATAAGDETGDIGSPRRAPTPGRDHDTTDSTTVPSTTGTVEDDAGIDANSEAAASLPTFTDDFNRPNATNVGNGWFEKTPGKFPLVANASQQNTQGDYRNLFVSRPTSEDALDVLVQSTITLASTMADPCIFARIQMGASTQQDHFIGYSLYPDGPANLYISRDDGTVFNDVGSAMISPALTAGTPYRLSLTVTGTNPVHLIGSIATLDGTVLAAITTNDSTNKRLTSAGSVGFGSSTASGGRFDDFKRITLP